ncbi:MAG: hypothetical protein J1F69_00610 [Clostridiales bacterium]|nr:hypothetical protein [Clostridiales bacterium]
MKKRLLTILSLIMAFVLCFSLVACGGDSKKSGGKKPAGDDKKPTGKEVSVTLGDVLDVINGVLNAEGFEGTASYTLSTKNKGSVGKIVSVDKRGSKVQAGDYIVDLETGDVYYNSDNGYQFKQYWYVDIYDYLLGLINDYAAANADETIIALYDKDAKTVTYTLDEAKTVNKYISPLQTAYASNMKSVNAMLDDYCYLLFGKGFHDMYDVFLAYIKDENNTVGDLNDMVKDAVGVDILSLVGRYMGFDGDTIALIEARKLSQVVAGAYDYAMVLLKQFMPDFPLFQTKAENDKQENETPSVGNDKMTMLMAMLDAMFFADVDTDGLENKLNTMVAIMDLFPTKALVDMIFADQADFAEVYTVIKDGVKFKDLYAKITLTLDDELIVKGVKVDCLASHTYAGNEQNFRFLSDNNYAATGELVISDYTADGKGFDITFDPDFDYRHVVHKFLFDLPDTDLSVHYETGDKEMAFDRLEIYDNDRLRIEVPNNEVRFDSDTSSFVFDSAFLKTVFEGKPIGARLEVDIHFADGVWVPLVLTNAVGAPKEVLMFIGRSAFGRF